MKIQPLPIKVPLEAFIRGSFSITHKQEVYSVRFLVLHFNSDAANHPRRTNISTAKASQLTTIRWLQRNAKNRSGIPKSAVNTLKRLELLGLRRFYRSGHAHSKPSARKTSFHFYREKNRIPHLPRSLPKQVNFVVTHFRRISAGGGEKSCHSSRQFQPIRCTAYGVTPWTFDSDQWHRFLVKYEEKKNAFRQTFSLRGAKQAARFEKCRTGRRFDTSSCWRDA